MNPTLATALRCLKAVTTETAANANAATQGQLAIAGRLLDFLAVQNQAGEELRSKLLIHMRELVPSLTALLGSRSELDALNGSLAAGNFDDCLSHMAALQRVLATNDKSEARRFVSTLSAVEADYHRELQDAVDRQSQAKTAASKEALDARNFRHIDPHAVQQFLRRNFPDETALQVDKCAVLSGGRSKLTVEVRLRDVQSLPQEIILRADAGATFGGASSVDEYRLLRVLYDAGVRVPRPLATDESGQIVGSKFMMVEKKPGVSVGHMFMLPQANKAVCHDVAEQLARIHRIPVEKFGERTENWHSSSSHKARAWLAEGLAAWRPLKMPSATFEAAFEWLERHADQNDRAPRGLVHGDVHLANILVHENTVSTILDWEFAHIGNPAYDLGYFYDQAIALDSWDAFLTAYRNAGGYAFDQSQLDYAVLFAATRLGVMTAQSNAAFVSGAEPGLSGAAVLGYNFYEMTIRRIDRVLQKVL